MLKMKYLIKRTIAYLIDCIICYSAIMLIIQWAILSNLREYFGLTIEWFRNSINMELYVLLSISFPVWFYFVYFDSNKANGTVGKKIMKLSVLSIEEDKILISKSLKRTFLKLLPWELAHLGVIFPTPLYFEEQGNIRLLTIIGISLFAIYVMSILIGAKGQSIYDKLLKTIVIEK